MTISDLVARLQSMISQKGMLPVVKSTAQVKIGKQIGNKDDVYEYFDIVKQGNDIVLMPVDKWDRRGK